MYGHNTSSPSNLDPRDEQFQSILVHAASTIHDRLKTYDPKGDPLKRSHLQILWDIVMLEVDRVAIGESRRYSGLESPIKAVCDWGEPEDSALTASLRDAEIFFRRHYDVSGQTVH